MPPAGRPITKCPCGHWSPQKPANNYARYKKSENYNSGRTSFQSENVFKRRSVTALSLVAPVCSEVRGVIRSGTRSGAYAELSRRSVVFFWFFFERPLAAWPACRPATVASWAHLLPANGRMAINLPGQNFFSGASRPNSEGASRPIISTQQ